MYCISCGQENVDDAKFCLKCGKPFDITSSHENNKMAPLPTATPLPSPTPSPTPTPTPSPTPGTEPGTDPGTEPGTDPGTDPGTEPGLPDTDTPYQDVDYTPINISYPGYIPRDYIAPGVSYSSEYPQGYTAFDDVYEPYIYNPPPVQSYMVGGPPLIYDPFTTLPTVYESINSLPQTPSGYQPLSLGNIQKIIDNIG